MKHSPVKQFYTLFWVLLLCALGVYYLFFAPRDGGYSQTENRSLAAFPTANAKSVFSGQFGTDLETYLLDSFPARDDVVSATNRLYATLSLASHEEYLQIAEIAEDPLDSDVDQGSVDDLLGELAEDPRYVVGPQPTESVNTEDAEDPPITQKPTVALDSFPDVSGIYYNIGTGDQVSSIFYRSNVAAVTAVLNKYARQLPRNGKLMFTVVPQSFHGNRFVNAAEKVSFYSTWDNIVNGVSDNNVYAFDTAEILSAPIQQNQYVYFRTDMHWTPYGSYLVYAQMVQQAGKTPCSYTNDFTMTTESPFRGTYYRDNPAAYSYVQADVLELLMPRIPLQWRRVTGEDGYSVIDFLNMNANRNDRYTVYLGGPGSWAYAQCENGQTENCLVLTDSFGLSFVPFLTTNYRQVHYYDPRYFNAATAGGTVAELIRKYNIQDIYVVVGDLHSFDSAFLMTYANSQLGID